MTCKEFVTRGNSDPAMQLGGGVAIRMFASAALGAEGLTTCSATFQSGSQIPYHTHPTSEVITAAIGEAEALIEGRRYRLAPYDAIHVPAGVAHAVRNVAAGVIVMHTCFPTVRPNASLWTTVLASLTVMIPPAIPKTLCAEAEPSATN